MDEGKTQVGKSTLLVRSQFKTKDAKGPIEEEDELLAVHKFLAPPAEVGVSMGRTISLGNYEFFRIDVVVKVPCYKEEVEEAYIYARKFCESRLKTEAESIKNESPF